MGKLMPTQERLAALLSYTPATGDLVWKERDSADFRDGLTKSAHQKCREWNAKNAGARAFTALNTSGYRHGSIEGVHYLAHRLIWVILHGRQPDCVDHINGDRQDNRACNLRTASHAENDRNRRLTRRNSSGVAGVSWSERRQAWVARICVNYKEVHLGYFSCFDEATAARKKAEIAHGFHPNHGRAA